MKALGCCTFGLALGFGAAFSQTANPEGIEFFEAKVRPVLVEHCYKCHSKEAEKVKGSLLLDSRDGLLKGGDTGAAIVPGDPEKSLLIKAVRYVDENLQMPPKGKKLSAEQIAILERWVSLGAPDPRVAGAGTGTSAETILNASRSHWAFTPVKRPELPKVSNQRWVQTPVDAFILSKLEQHGLTPSARADRQTLLRRATYDLTGLPPSGDDMAGFLADKSPEAFEKALDRLLSSPQYGERWGRHWLDVARYADTKGYVFEEERRYPYSYTYRDYVIRAFNEDLPFDQFIIQQVAADLLPLGEDKRALAALGYLTLGRRFVNNIHDIIDDRIDVVCRGMMGLTVSCARCHDHKYDPIPTRDYYSLYGVFSSCTEPDEKPLLGAIVTSKPYEDYLAEHKKRVEARAEFRRTKEAELLARLRAQAGDYLLAAANADILTNKSEIDGLAHTRKLHPSVLQRWMKTLQSWQQTNHPVFAAWFALAKLPEEDFAAKAKVVIEGLSNSTPATVNPMVSQTLVTQLPVSLKEVSERYGKLFGEIDQRWQESLTNDARKELTSDASAFADPAAEAIRQVLYAPDAPGNVAASEFDRLFDVPTSQKLRELQRKIDELAGTHPGAPPRAMALVDKPNPANVQVFVRGNSDNRGAEAPRQFLEILSEPNRKPFERGSGRLELAQEIASARNPLTARVLVNRVWLHHFGVGLVRTPSDFGLRSEPPSHPELLDYLAARFMEEGWSIKKLHRWIMSSSVYQQSSENREGCARVDPSNQLLWRMNRQRLDFEELRDTLLAVAGKLDLTPGGHPVDIIKEPFAPRRAVYGYIDRQNLPGLFRTFDFASPDSTSPQRFHTTVPQQALFLMNNAFVVQQARQLVDQDLFRNLASDADRINMLYQRVFQRPATREEVALGCRYYRSCREAKPPPITVWQYGYGAFDETTRRVTKFERLPHFTGSQVQGGPELPDPKLGWVMLNEHGGHVGNDLQHAAIRRWTAPGDAWVSVSGLLRHDSEKGDGVRGRIVSSRAGQLGEWSVHNEKKETKVESIAVRAGDTIDFVTDCQQTVDHDSFGWEATIRVAENPEQAAKKSWSTSAEFADSARSTQNRLNAWEQYAQVLLLSNELIFVD